MNPVVYLVLVSLFASVGLSLCIVGRVMKVPELSFYGLLASSFALATAFFGGLTL